MGFLVTGLILGAIGVVAVEAALLWYFIFRLTQNTKKAAPFSSSSSSVDSGEVLDHQQSLDFAFDKKGFIWVLESEKLPREKALKEQKKKKDPLEVYPVRKYAKIKHRALTLTAPDGSQTAFPLKGCIIEAVSASNLSSRKWAKRFPIKVENKTSVLYKGNKIIYIFMETSWEKEAWCKALRLASSVDKERLDWFTKLNKEFHIYLASLTAGYPSFMKPPVGVNGDSPSMGFLYESIERSNRDDGPSSKVRLLWKKLARKASKASPENRACSSYSGREERKVIEKLRPSQDLVKSGASKGLNSYGEESAEPLSSTLPQSKSQSQLSVISDVESDDKLIVDEGTLCWNLLIFRLFFDAKNNIGLKSSIQSRIQRTLSNMRAPSYIGEIICTGIDTGNVPPYVQGMRVLPMDMTEVWAFEVDIEYAGGVVLDVETRLEVGELDVQKGILDVNSEEASSVGDVSADLLEGFESFGNQLNVSEGTTDGQGHKDEGDPKLVKDDLKNNKSPVSGSTTGSRWKSILNSVAKQVSQVPISLSIRVSALRGTLRLHIKPPPSDQLWFGFTSMPDIEFDLESSVGDHKITSGQVALYLINRFKASIRETMVLPNCESVAIPWMLAEKNDWVPRNVAPFIWLSHEANTDHATTSEAFTSHTTEDKTTAEATRATSISDPEHKNRISRSLDCNQQPRGVSKVASMPSTSSSIPSIKNSKSLQELRTPLLEIAEPQEGSQQKNEELSECPSPSMALAPSEGEMIVTEEDESRPKKSGRKARMLDLGKNMKEKLEEKRRHIEEKGRHIVEKMRGP